jgi:hypothetical protein
LGHLDSIVKMMFLKKKMGSNLEERRQLVDGEAGDDMLQARVQVAQKSDDEIRIRNRRLKIM